MMFFEQVLAEPDPKKDSVEGRVSDPYSSNPDPDPERP